MTHFNVIEAAPDRFGGRIILQAETLEEIQTTWRENKVWVPKDMDDKERFEKKRLENYSWRIMSKVHMHDVYQNLLRQKEKESHQKFLRPPLKSYASTADLSSFKTRHNESDSNFASDDLSTATATAVQINGNSRRLKYAPSESSLHALKDLNRDRQLDSCSINYRHPVIDNLPGKSRTPTHHRQTITYNRSIGKIGKGGLCVEFADHGTGDFRTPSFMLVDNFNGSSISPLRYRNHRIYRGKLEIPDRMPGIRCFDENEASTLVVTLADVICGIEVDLIYGKCCSEFRARVTMSSFQCSDDAQLRCHNSSHSVPQC